MSRQITLVGGPCDGLVYAIQPDLLVFTVATAVAPQFDFSPDEDTDPFTVKTVEHQYAVHRTRPIALYVPPRVGKPLD